MMNYQEAKFKLIAKDNVLVNDKVVKASYKVKLNDEITLILDNEEDIDIEMEDIPLDIVYEDNDVIVINKPSGMVVHPSLGHKSIHWLMLCYFIVRICLLIILLKDLVLSTV